MVSVQEKIKFIILRTIGNFLVLFSIFGIAMTFGPALAEEGKYRYVKFRNIQYVVSENTDISVTPSPGPIVGGPTPTRGVPEENFGEIPTSANVQVLRPLDPNFSVVIPKIGANAKVIPNVDAGNYESYIEALTKGVAHADGTGFPGGGTRSYLFAHSTDSFWNVGRYNAVFYLLKELNPGDEIYIFYSRVRYKYIVTEKKIVPPTEVQYLTDKTAYEELILQTCWPPGTTLDRLLVFARPDRDI